ncbi:MAG: hypothetical protein HON94_09495, partial [Methylococcales bacterium]|nr:hypothetical protein [Methylococcales bacterium]
VIAATAFDKNILIKIGEQKIPIKSTLLLYQSVSKYSRHKPTKTAFFSRIIMNHLITNDQLKNIPIDQQTTLRHQAKANSSQLLVGIIPSSNLPYIDIKYQLDDGKKQLEKFLQLADKNKKSPRSISYKQKQMASQWRVANYHADKNIKGFISFWDLLDQVSIHDWAELMSFNQSWIKKNIRSKIYQKVVMTTALEKLKISPTELKELQQRLFEQLARSHHEQSIGVVEVLHRSNKNIKKQAKNISDQAIKDYYLKHIKDYMQPSMVKAQHIRLNSQQQADKVYHEIRQGMSFNQAVKKYSQANDTNTTPPGDLGTITQSSQPNSFLEKISFLQRKGDVSLPIRTNKAWEILLIRERQDQVVSVDDMSIRHHIKNILAKQSIRQQYSGYLSHLAKQSKLSINPAYPVKLP